MADERAMARVRALEDVLGPAEHGDERGRLLEDDRVARALHLESRGLFDGERGLCDVEIFDQGL